MSFVVVPQWQGSPSSRAMRLAEGAEAIRGDLPAASTRVVEIPWQAGDAQGTGIARYSSLQLVRQRMAEALGSAGSPAIVIGGDCGVSGAAVAHAASPEVALVWFDAHPDLNTPASSPSGAYGGMVLASLIDDGLVEPQRVLLAGARAWDEAEAAFAAERGVRSLSVEQLADAEAVADAVVATGATRVFVHIDLDVLDPADFAGLLDPIPFGVPAAHLVATVRALVARVPLAGATIASFAPESVEASVDDASTILRLIAALRTSR